MTLYRAKVVMRGRRGLFLMGLGCHFMASHAMEAAGIREPRKVRSGKYRKGRFYFTRKGRDAFLAALKELPKTCPRFFHHRDQPDLDWRHKRLRKHHEILYRDRYQVVVRATRGKA